MESFGTEVEHTEEQATQPSKPIYGRIHYQWIAKNGEHTLCKDIGNTKCSQKLGTLEHGATFLCDPERYAGGPRGHCPLAGFDLTGIRSVPARHPLVPTRYPSVPSYTEFQYRAGLSSGTEQYRLPIGHLPFHGRNSFLHDLLDLIHLSFKPLFQSINLLSRHLPRLEISRNVCYAKPLAQEPSQYEISSGVDEEETSNRSSCLTMEIKNTMPWQNDLKQKYICRNLCKWIKDTVTKAEYRTGPCIPTSSSKGTSSAPSASSSPSNICSTCASRRAACISKRAATFSAFLLIICPAPTIPGAPTPSSAFPSTTWGLFAGPAALLAARAPCLSCPSSSASCPPNWWTNKNRYNRQSNLALASVAVSKPLEKAILVNELDASTASTRVSKRVIRVAWIPTNPADVPLVLLLFEPGSHRSQTRVVGDLIHGRIL
ncbi:hypothetical protein M5K25_026684 [Dendrobium thyrsiflorum]|uniref:Uncharacterized protein n=1 Tax=Dendrobium thyrsiflorum TaxID=117978 RepID=A0ABD0TYE0_DENTH